MKITITDDRGHVRTIKVDSDKHVEVMENEVIVALADAGFKLCDKCGHLGDEDEISHKQSRRTGIVTCENCI